MSAIRYCGTLRIRLTIVNRGLQGINEEYRCFITATDVIDSDHCTIYVRTPASLDSAIDSPAAFDHAAHVALSSASAENWPVEAHAWSKADGSGWDIQRRTGRPANRPARLDTDRTAKPRTRIVGDAVLDGHCVAGASNANLANLALEDTETKERTPIV